MMRGETVYVDGAPVDNVLVRPGEHADETGVDVPAGVVVAYTLAFPYDAFPEGLEDARVTVRGIECATVGRSDHTRPRDVFGPIWDLGLNPWDMAVTVQRTAGDMSAEVSVLAASTVYGPDGRPVRIEETLYSGMAQARRADGGEDRIADGSKRSRETWFFVMPWGDGLASARPESAWVEMGAIRYDVVGIDNLGGRSEYASIQAVRRG